MTALGTFFRYICDNGHTSRHDDLFTGKDEQRVAGRGMDGIKLQHREFMSAIYEGREPNGSVAQALRCHRTSQRLSRSRRF